MKIDLRKQLHAYGQQITVLGKTECEGIGILYRKDGKEIIDEFSPKMTERGEVNPCEYHLWFALCDPSDSVEEIEKVRINGRVYEKISGEYDPTFCCFRFMVREAGL